MPQQQIFQPTDDIKFLEQINIYITCDPRQSNSSPIIESMMLFHDTLPNMFPLLLSGYLCKSFISY